MVHLNIQTVFIRPYSLDLAENLMGQESNVCFLFRAGSNLSNLAQFNLEILLTFVEPYCLGIELLDFLCGF